MRLTAGIRHELLRIDSKCVEYRRCEISRGHWICEDFTLRLDPWNFIPR